MRAGADGPAWPGARVDRGRHRLSQDKGSRFSTLPASTSLADLVHLAKLRWRIERDYQELKDELGLDHFGGRGWRGFHHHGALCIAAYAFPAAERARLSPPEASGLPHTRSPSQRAHAAGRSRCGLNAMFPHRSPRPASSWPARCCNGCPLVHLDARRRPTDVFQHSSTNPQPSLPGVSISSEGAL